MTAYQALKSSWVSAVEFSSQRQNLASSVRSVSMPDCKTLLDFGAHE